MITVADQEELNARYQAILSKVYGGTVTVSGRFLNSKSVVLHNCNNCNKEFWGKPLWLTNGKQPHKCYETLTEGKAPKKVKKPKAKKGNSTPGKVTEAMRMEMVQLYSAGESLKAIAKKFEVTPPTVKNHLKIAKVELR